MHRLYSMPEGGGPCTPLAPLTAKAANERGLGIFWTVHEFEGRRLKENLTQLNGFAVDIDGENKPEKLEKLKRGLVPSLLIETKSGFHAYWFFHEPLVVKYSEALEERYRAVMVKRLLPFYGADTNARDLCRILRVPYFLHQKDPKDPFMIQCVHDLPVRYTWEQFEVFYPDVEAEKFHDENVAQAKRVLQIPKSGELFDKIYRLDCQAALEALSGHAGVNGETFSFKKTNGGNYNILVNGKGTSCWIDKNKRIGSTDKGGPTIWQWLYWYQRDHKKVYEIVKEVFGL